MPKDSKPVNELALLSGFVKKLEALDPDEARKRVLRYLAEKFAEGK